MKWNKWTAACGIAALSLLATVAAEAAGKSVAPQVIEIQGKKYTYVPDQVTLVKGVTYRLHLTSDDVPHSLRIKALNLNWEMKKGQFDDVLFTPEQVGDFTGDCGLYCGSGHKTMAMVIHVVNK